MYLSKYYTDEEIDERLLQGYYDDFVEQGYTGSRIQFIQSIINLINNQLSNFEITVEGDHLVFTAKNADDQTICSINLEAATSQTPGLMTPNHVQLLDMVVSMLGFYVCTSPANEEHKEVDAPGYVLHSGGAFSIKMQYSNTILHPTLEINHTGQKPLLYNGTSVSQNNKWKAGEVIKVFFDGTNYQAYPAKGVVDRSTGGASTAADVSYDSEFTHLEAQNVQDALDELYGLIQAKQQALTVDTNAHIIKAVIDGHTYVIPGVQELVAPVISFSNPHIFDGSGNISISVTPSGAQVYYTKTTDGTTPPTPTTASTRYTNPISISQDTNVEQVVVKIKALATINGESRVKEDTYYVNRKLTCSIAVSGDIYDSNRTVTLTSHSGATIYYTDDGTSPLTSETKKLYNSPIPISSTKTIKAYATNEHWANSDVVTSSVTVGTMKMYYGLVDSKPTTVGLIESLTPKKQNSITTPVVCSFSGYGKVCLAYNKDLGSLTSIKDENGWEYNYQFNNGEIVGNYRVYTMNGGADQSGKTYTFKK